MVRLFMWHTLSHRPDQVAPLWQRLVTSHAVQPNTVSLNARMQAVSSTGDWQAALQLFQAMQVDPRTRPDVVSYGCVMRACERAGQWALAITLFDEMLEAGLRPNARVFASAIGACERGQQWERAIDLFRLMQVGGCCFVSSCIIAPHITSHTMRAGYGGEP